MIYSINQLKEYSQLLIDVYNGKNVSTDQIWYDSDPNDNYYFYEMGGNYILVQDFIKTLDHFKLIKRNGMSLDTLKFFRARVVPLHRTDNNETGYIEVGRESFITDVYYDGSATIDSSNQKWDIAIVKPNDDLYKFLLRVVIWCNHAKSEGKNEIPQWRKASIAVRELKNMLFHKWKNHRKDYLKNGHRSYNFMAWFKINALSTQLAGWTDDFEDFYLTSEDVRAACYKWISYYLNFRGLIIDWSVPIKSKFANPNWVPELRKVTSSKWVDIALLLLAKYDISWERDFNEKEKIKIIYTAARQAGKKIYGDRLK